MPVLSEQIQSAPPIVSQASYFLTRFESCNILFTEKANDKVTDNGKPSGIATTTTVIQMMKKDNSLPQCSE